MIYPNIGTLFANKKPTIINNVADTKTLCQIKELNIKDHILYDSIYITFMKWQNCRDGGQISSYQGLEIVWGRRKDLTIKDIMRDIFVVIE